MKRLWRRIIKILNSRRLAVYLLGTMVAVLILSAFLPSHITMTREEWSRLEIERPWLYSLSSSLSTPYVVRNPGFMILSGFLFLSTLSCTATRLKTRLKMRASEFEKDKAFSFSIARNLRASEDSLLQAISKKLKTGRWKLDAGVHEGLTVIEARKGSDLGFWGSMIFHFGLLVCFVAVPATAFTVFRGQFLTTNNIPTSLREGFIVHEGRALTSLPDIDILVKDLKASYEKGIYKLDFRGVLDVENERIPFAVNKPALVRGYQFTLHEFGFASQVILKKSGSTFFDYYLNLRNAQQGDYFDLPGTDVRMFVLFFPDFFREGRTIGSRSNETRNPVLMVSFRQGGEELSKGLIKLGDEIRVGEYEVTFNDLTNWANFVVVKEGGVAVLALGLVIGILGLLLRFLSNERLLEVNLCSSGTETEITLKGYSKYYPAFLEKEVVEMADGLAGGRLND